MPLKRRRPKTRTTLDHLTDGQTFHLCFGADYFGDGFNGDIAEMETAWRRHRDEIVDAFTELNCLHLPPKWRPRPEWAEPWAAQEFASE